MTKKEWLRLIAAAVMIVSAPIGTTDVLGQENCEDTEEGRI